MLPLSDIYANILASMLWDAAKAAFARRGMEGAEATLYVRKVDEDGQVLKWLRVHTTDPEMIRDLIHQVSEEKSDQTRDDATLLLIAPRRVHEYQYPNTSLTPGMTVDPYAACELLGWGNRSPRCRAALESIEAELALEPNPLTDKALGPTHIWGTEAGHMLGEE